MGKPFKRVRPRDMTHCCATRWWHAKGWQIAAT